MANQPKPLTRDKLAKFLPDHESIRRFEELFQVAQASASDDTVFVLIETLSSDLSASRSEIQRLSTKISQLEGLIASIPGMPALTGPIRSSGNTTSIASQTGTGMTFAMQDSPTLTTPDIGVATATSVNKLAITAPAAGSTLEVADGKTLIASNSLTLVGTDATVMTFPATDATIARTDAAQTFTGDQSIAGDIITSSTTLHKTSASLANGAAAAAGTLLNAPAAGNPTKWVPIDDNGVIRHFPTW